MGLNKEQIEELKKMASAGKSLGEIQSAFQEKGVTMTYMELRFLVDDLGVTLQEKPRQKTAPPISPAVPETAEKELTPNPAETAEGVKVGLDTVVRAGAVISGEATFTDGVKVQWALDQFGRLALMGAPQGYKPPAEDLQDFQTKLREMIESRGGF